MKKTSGRIYRGNIPADGTLIDTNGEWALYQRETKQGFVNFKVVSLSPRVGKANYHIAYAPSEKRLARNVDGKELQRMHPNLTDWVMELLYRRFATAVQGT